MTPPNTGWAGGEAVPGLGWIPAAVDGLGGFDVNACVVAELPEAVASLDGLIRLVEVARADVLARLDASGFTDTDEGLGTPSWMSKNLVRPRRKCAADVKSARAMNDTFPLLGESIRAGGPFTLDHLAFLLNVSNPRNQQPFTEIQPQLIDIAGCTTFQEFENEMRRLGHMLDQDGPFNPEQERRRSSISLRNTPDGVRVNGEFVGTMAATVIEALNELTDRKAREQFDREDDNQTNAGITYTRSQLMAQAFEELCRNRRPLGASPVIDMTLIVHADRMDRAVSSEGAVIDGGSYDMCSCDAWLRVVTVDDNGQPLNMSRAKRFATDAQRRAAGVRDGGCAFPGCDMPTRWTDLHHIQHWQHGGRTDINNMVCLCRSHHGTVHSNGWSMTRHDDGTYTFTNPHGRTITSKPRGPSRAATA